MFLEPSFKLFRSARQFYTLCCNSTPLHSPPPPPQGFSKGNKVKVPFPCCQGLGHRDSGVGDFSKKGLGVGAWLAACSEQEGLALFLGS